MSGSGRPRAIVLVIDRWGAPFSGPYGNTWLETPACNELANAGLLFEQAFVEGASLSDYYMQLWGNPRPTWSDHAPATPADAGLLARLSAAGARSRLITDDESISQLPLAADFTTIELQPPPIVRRPARSIERAAIARLLATAWAQANSDDVEEELIWVHSRGMAAPWDAPPEFRQQFVDEDDPEPPVAVEPPEGPVPADSDPDLLQGWLWAYAAQVCLLDCCLQPWLESWRAKPAGERPLLILMGARGYPLGEHGYWGAANERLHSELIHVPLFVLTGRPDDARFRSQTIVQLTDVRATLAHWLLPAGGDPPGGLLARVDGESAIVTDEVPRLAISRAGEERAIRTSAWHVCYKQQPPTYDAGDATAGGASDWQLYLKPDDRWEVNDVADRCPDVLAAFRELAQQLAAAEAQGQTAVIAKLAAELSE
ncbi:MAG: hypothetical protein KDB23_04295 [Planctomycetales bacterium]|nr:hypothetical protein [Planctomycetales bacterium]